MKSGFRPAQGAEPRPAYVGFDEGLRQHMLGIYRNMGLALLVSASVAWLIASTPALYQPIFGTPLKWVAMLAPLAFVFVFSFRFEKMSWATRFTM